MFDRGINMIVNIFVLHCDNFDESWLPPETQREDKVENFLGENNMLVVRNICVVVYSIHIGRWIQQQN